MSTSHTKELELLEKICEGILRTGKIPVVENLKLNPSFQKRYDKAVKIMENQSVSRYKFNPSGRVVWAVKGKEAEYQVMPETNFCSCDDFYFRVMGYKRQVCYHLIAQRIAYSLKRFKEHVLRDSEYDQVMEKWRIKQPAEPE